MYRDTDSVMNPISSEIASNWYIRLLGLWIINVSDDEFDMEEAHNIWCAPSSTRRLRHGHRLGIDITDFCTSDCLGYPIVCNAVSNIVNHIFSFTHLFDLKAEHQDTETKIRII